jgi:hypothetical protein
MKHTQNIAEILQNVASNKLSVEEATSAIQMLITAHSGTRANPGIYVNGKLVGKWCTKHQQYEPVDMFPKNSRSSDGLYSHCRYAEKRAKSYIAKIAKLKDNYFKAKDAKVEAKIKEEIKKLESSKNDYSFEVDAPEDKIAELKQFRAKHERELSAEV